MTEPNDTIVSVKPKWYRRHWVQLVAVGIVGLGIGGAGSGSSAADAESKRVAAESSLSQAQTMLAQAEKDRDAAVSDAAAAKTTAESAAAAEVAKVKTDLAAQAAALAAREKKVSGAEAVAKSNTFDGADGKYIVGTDIKAGTYRGTPSSGCYYARLSSLNDNDIIENNNTDGPVAIRILSGDKAFQVKDCGTFTRIGN